jgi:hypothetical protein
VITEVPDLHPITQAINKVKPITALWLKVVFIVVS